jgi:hypothetical protein
MATAERSFEAAKLIESSPYFLLEEFGFFTSTYERGWETDLLQA